MATNPDKSSNLFPLKASARPHDFSLDPLPVPDAIESDSDTAWGLWEDTLQAHDDPKPASEFDGAYDVTVPGVLTGSEGKKV